LGPILHLLAFAGGAPQAAARAQDPPAVALVNANVVDVERGALVARQTIVVSRGRIVDMGRSGSVRIPRGATRIDIGGRFVIPGLWDMHVHVGGTSPDVRALAGYYGSLFLAHGVTGVREAGGNANRLAALDSIGRSQPGLMPRLIYAGEKIGPGPGESWSADDARSAIEARSRAGAHYIKLAPDYPVELFEQTLATCAGARLACVAHVPPADTALWLSAPGRGSFEHLFNLAEHVSRVPAAASFAAAREYEKPTIGQRVLYKLRLRRRPPDPQLQRIVVRDTSLDRGFFGRVASSGTWITPTLVLHRQMTRVTELDPASVDTSLARNPAAPDTDRGPAQLQAARQTWELWTGLVRAMHAARVRLLAGTDFSGAHVPGAILHGELALLQQAGVPPADVLRMATINPARYLGAADSLGTVQPGRVADLVVLRRNPLDDARNVSEVEMVMTRGRLLRRPALDSLVQGAHSALVRLRAVPDRR
jgi:imidazolonepropionase-like amidohydrolase